MVDNPSLVFCACLLIQRVADGGDGEEGGGFDAQDDGAEGDGEESVGGCGFVFRRGEVSFGADEDGGLPDVGGAGLFKDGAQGLGGVREGGVDFEGEGRRV